MLPITRLSLIICIVAITAMSLHSQELISGSATITLSGPATKEVQLQAETEARKKLRVELLHWIQDGVEITIDTNNAVQRKSFSMFVDSCRNIAKSETSFKGKVLTLNYLLTAEQAYAKLQKYNQAVDARATENWTRLQAAQEQNDNHGIYSSGIKALFYALAHLGPPIATPGIEGRDLVDDVRSVVQAFFDKMQVASSGTILEGKTGLDIENQPTISILIDSVPFSGFTFTGSMQNGAILFSLPTNDKGQVTLNTFKIPFVANGTLLEACPDVGPQLGLTEFVNPKHFGIKLNKSQVQAFMFKVTAASYTLDFKATSASTITMPPDFANAAHINKYLQDSCFLKAGAGSTTDLAITIHTQVSSYTYDATEEVGVKVSSEITVDGLLFNPKRTNKQLFVFEKRYGRYLTLPYGLYFWEATGKLREAIKTTIAGL